MLYLRDISGFSIGWFNVFLNMYGRNEICSQSHVQ